MAFQDDIATDRTNVFFNTDEFAYSGTFSAPGSASTTAFKYLQRDLPDTRTHERRMIFVDDDAAAIAKNYVVNTADKSGWRVQSTGLNHLGKTEIEIWRQLKKD